MIFARCFPQFDRRAAHMGERALKFMRPEVTLLSIVVELGRSVRKS